MNGQEKINLLFRGLCLLLALKISGPLLTAQAPYSASDPRWTDEDPTNDPNTCFEPESNCETQEEWARGWCEARALSGLSSCGAPQANSGSDPRWTDEDTTNDPNTCFEPESNCETQEEWTRGWYEARALSGLSPNVAPQANSGSQGAGGGSSSQQRQSGGASASLQSQASEPSSASIRRGRYRPDVDCPYGKVCVGHWPSGEIEVFDVGDCCYPSQAIDRFNAYD